MIEILFTNAWEVLLPIHLGPLKKQKSDQTIIPYRSGLENIYFAINLLKIDFPHWNIRTDRWTMIVKTESVDTWAIKIRDNQTNVFTSPKYLSTNLS